METKKKGYAGLILVVLLLVPTIIFIIAVRLPVQAGEMGLIQSLMKWGSAIHFPLILLWRCMRN